MEKSVSRAVLHNTREKRNSIHYPPAGGDLIRLDSLGAAAYAKARRYTNAGEFKARIWKGKAHARRADLADFDVIDFGAAVTLNGEFLGDAVHFF